MAYEEKTPFMPFQEACDLAKAEEKFDLVLRVVADCATDEDGYEQAASARLSRTHAMT